MISPRIPRALGAGLASSALLASVLLVVGMAPVPGSASGGPCGEAGGVTVVVDFTDLGGSIVTGCAAGDPATGRSALAAAGFVAVDSQPGMICTIDAQPDPCPATFQGSFWSYWHAAAGDDWISYQVGADSSDPVAGEIEGWRYNDGVTGPGIAPAEAASAVIAVAPTATTDGPASTPGAAPANDMMLFVALSLGLVIAVIALILFMRSRRHGTLVED